MNSQPSPPLFKTILFTVLTLVAFAANSVLARLALGDSSIDAVSFTTLRLFSGALVLALILQVSQKPATPSRGSWLAGLMLFAYASTFSFAYNSLDTGTGALILFGAVQLSMILIAIFQGVPLTKLEWLGMIVAFAGFVYLVSPGVSTPPIGGLVLMSIAGVAWGCYTVAGKGSSHPLGDTAFNFLRSTPLAIGLFLLGGFTYGTETFQTSTRGVLLAILSGAVTSGIGYTLWYSALRGLTTTQAAVVQLSVPIIAALGGVLLVGESVTMRLVVSASLILGGILVVILGRKKAAQ